MSVSSYFAGGFAVTSEKTASGGAKNGGAGFLARVLAAIATAREAQANREANRYLARQPDRLLRDIGLDEREIADLRRQYDL